MTRKRRKNMHGGEAAQYIMLPYRRLRCKAWLSLSPAARAVYLEICLLYNGSNNGTLGLSVRRAAARCRIAKDTASRAFRELQDRRFIDCVQKGAFSLKARHASEWRLTHEACNVTGELPTHPYKEWMPEKQNPVPVQSVTIRPIGPLAVKKAA